MLFLLAGCGQNQPSPTLKPIQSESIQHSRPYSLPTEFSIKAQAQRTTEGAIVVSGTTNFPDDMKMWIEIMEGAQQGAQDSKVIIRNGSFSSTGFMKKNRPYPPGVYSVQFSAEFNEAWQSPDILSILGKGGKNLHAGGFFKLTDPDVIDSDKALEYLAKIPFPPISEDSIAIESVKHAILTVPDKGRSATDIEENLKLFMDPKTGCRPAKEWSAKTQGNRVYLVSYDFINGPSGEDQATWSVDLKSKAVKYINMNAKLFSWTPKD